MADYSERMQLFGQALTLQANENKCCLRRCAAVPMGSASMRATLGGRMMIKAAEPAALKSRAGLKKPNRLERKHQTGGWHRGMGEFVDLEAGHFEVRAFVHKTTVLCAHEEVF